MLFCCIVKPKGIQLDNLLMDNQYYLLRGRFIYNWPGIYSKKTHFLFLASKKKRQMQEIRIAEIQNNNEESSTGGESSGDESVDTDIYEPENILEQKKRNALKSVLYKLHKDWRWSIGSKIIFWEPSPNRDFYLQFTALRWDQQEKEWHLETILTIPGSEIIYEVNVEYADNDQVTLKSWKHNWRKCYFYGKTRTFKTDEIPLYTLWDDFQTHHYTGRVWMR